MKQAEHFRNILAVAFPRWWTCRLRRQTYRTCRVVNDLTVYPRLTLPYDPAGTYVTMFKTPPKHYNKINAARTFDAGGIPLAPNKQYNVVTISQYGLTEYGYYQSTGEAIHLENAKRACDWLLKNQEPDTGYWRYEFEFVHRATGCKLKHWPSALGQGQAVSLLTRMHRLEPNERYLEVAKKALRMFDVPISEGGLLATFDGHWMYEEYPTDPASFTLNGMIFATFGLYDYLQLRQDARIQKLYDEGVEAIEYLLPLYDGEISSSYDLSHFTARKIDRVPGNKYHIIHIALLQNLNAVAPRPTFDYYIKKWVRMSGYTIQ